MKKKGYSVLQRLGSFALAVLMILGLLPVTVLADGAGSLPIGEATTVADPDTVSRPVDVYGSNTMNAGKVTVGKSVSDSAVTLRYGNTSQTFTPAENNFVVTVSQTAQVMGLASESAVPMDVVFILDTSGSMNYGGVNRAASMVSAANSAIKTLLEANEHNRIAVVAFSSNNYGGGTGNGAAASVLSSLAHYSGDAASAHLQWVNSQGSAAGNGTKAYIAGRDTATITVNQGGPGGGRPTTVTVNAFRHGYDGGTNIQAGIVTGAKLLTAASNDPTVTTENGTVTRMPFIVILSDGQPTYSYSNSTWYNPSTTGQQGDGNDAFAGNGFLTALTAAYYKGAITEKYYGANASENNRCSIYTIGVQLNEELAEITLDPKENLGGGNAYSNTFSTYWNNYNRTPATAFNIRVSEYSTFSVTAASIEASKNYVTGKSSTGAVMYNGGLAYNDDHFAAGETKDIAKAFTDVVASIQRKAISSPTKVDEAFGNDFSGYVTFTDPIGEYMEVKQVYGLLADGKWYQGQSFAYYLQNWASAPQEFKDQFTRTIQTRCMITGASLDMDDFIRKIVASENQAYYNSAADYDNSFVWWGNDIDSTSDVDEHVQFLDVADNDTIEYIQANQAVIEQLGADYVCRSYFFYGTAGDTSLSPDQEYLYFVIRVQRSLKAPYQQTVVVSAPASLLSVEKVMITESTNSNGDTTYKAAVTEAEPARVVYEVGLRSDINAYNVAGILAQDSAYLNETAEFDGESVYTNYNAEEGTYTFYTNDWDRTADENSHERAMTTATFDAAADNDFYTYQEDTLIYVKQGDSFVPYTGTDRPVGAGYYYARTVYDWEGAARNEDGSYKAVKKTEYIAVNLPNSDVIFENDGQWYIAKGAYMASSLTGGEDIYKSENKTQTSEVVVHPHRTSSENDSHYTVYLGNNGKLTLKSRQTKHVSVEKADGTVITDADGKVVMVGDVLTYTLDVINLSDEAVTADVTDIIPKGTVYVDGSATHGGQLVEGVLVWNDVPVAAGQTVQVSFRVLVTEAALSGDLDVVSIDNAASVTLSNGFSYTTNTTKNPPEGKKVVDSDGNPIEGGVDVPDVLVFRIRWYNDSGKEATVTVTDIIPEGTTYVANSASHDGVYNAANGTVTWTLKNVQPGASGVVSFRVNVNPNAVEYISNHATIRIGDNDPRQTNQTKTEVLTGNLVLTKTVVDNGYTGADDQSFTLKLTEIAMLLEGEFVMLRNGVEETVTFSGGVATVTIAHGDVLEIQGIPAGTIISVTEVPKNGFTPSYKVGSATGNTVTVLADTDAQVDVTNTYDPDAVTFQLEGFKVLATSSTVGDLTFGFTAYRCDGKGENPDINSLLTGEVTVSSDSKEASFKFAPVVFDKEGTYYYIISELNGGVNGVTYSGEKYLVQITVRDDGSGQLKASAKLMKYDSSQDTFVDANSVSFTNSYAPKQTKLKLEASKVLTGRKLKAGEFSFVVTDAAGNVVATGTNDASGKVTFREITYTKPGEYTYTISEVNGGQHGVDYSTAKVVITVKVEDVDGQLVATPSYPTGGVVFHNAFTPDGITVSLEANKVLENLSGDSSRVLKAGEFHFVVKDGDRVVATGTNDADGKIVFTPIGYTVADVGKTYAYTVSEVVPDLSGDPYMDYDESSFQVSVTISQDADGNLVETVTYPDGGVVFTNIQYPGSVEITPSGSKTTTAINDNIPQDASFSFTVINVDTGEEAGAGVGSANGDFLFSSMSYSEAGTYRYWLKETHSGQTVHGIEYDDTVYLMVVEVTLTDGKLVANVNYYALDEDGDPANPEDYTLAVYGVPIFQNHYDAKGQIDITATKVLNNLTLKSGEFAFRLIRQDNGHEITGIVQEDGTIRFATLYFDLGDFESPEQTERILHYKMSEVIPQAAKLPGVTYDIAVHDVFIKITHDSQTGVISAVLTDSEGNPLTDENGDNTKDTGVVFTNTYTPVEGTGVEIGADKTLTGRDLVSGEFSFNLYHIDEEGVEHLVDTAVNDADGHIRFIRTYAPTVLNGEDSRTIRYVIREVNSGLSGVTYSGNEFNVTVTVVDNKDGTMSATVVYEGLEEGELPKFENTYQAEGTTYTPEASKVLENRDLDAGEFSFVITDSTDSVVSTGTNDGEGKIVFTPIGYDTAGVYEYTVSEVKGNLPGVEYTKVTYKLVVTVVDNTEKGELEATGVFYKSDDTEYANPVDAVFTNIFTPENVSVQMEASKVLTGRDMEQGEFSFVVETMDGTVVATGGNAAAGNGSSAEILFSNIGYTLEDLNGADSVELFYRIRELGTTQGGVTVDGTVYYACVTLSNNEELGRLETSVSYYSGYDGTALTGKLDSVTFENTYAPKAASVVITAEKILVNKVLEAGEFTFVLADGEGNSLQEKTNAADGSVTFDAIGFTMPGTYVYTVSERVTDDNVADRYTLDDAFTVVVTVVDDLKGNLRATAAYYVTDASGSYDESVNMGSAEFINRYTAPPVTKDLSLAIDATKTVVAPNGITYSPEGFRFAVVDIRNNVVSIGVSDADGKIRFSDFTFDHAGEYHYWVYELDTDKGGIIKDNRTWEIHILVRYNEQTGLLYIADSDVQTYLNGDANEQDDPDFVNEYAPAPTTLRLAAKKVLEGRPLNDREFLFYLMEGEQIAARAYNAVDGTVTFELIYTQPGKYTYSVVEHVGALGGVSYDTKTYATLTVEVKDDGNGQLVAYVGGQAMRDGATVATGVTVTNTYEAKSAQATVIAHKRLLGGKLLKGEDFSFVLTNADDPEDVYIAKNNSDGHIEFLLGFDAVGEYIYSLQEVKGSDPSITYDESVYQVIISVTDDGKGQLHASVSYGEEAEHGVVFENTYKAQPVTAEIRAHKTLVGEKPLTAGQYCFELEGEGVRITEITNDANGNVVFHVTFDTVGEYTYVIRETKGADAGTTYDETEYTVKVVVTDDLNGNLVAEVTYVGLEEGKIPGFTNSYKGAEVPVKVTAGKILVDKKLTEGEFTFRLVNKLDADDVLTAKNDAEGNVVFDLVFENSGVYVYTLSEEIGTDDNITYDRNTYTVTVTVQDDLKGYLTAKVEYSTENGAAPVFRNAYTPNAIGITLEGTKKLTGRDLEDGEFSFQVRDSSGNLVATGKNAANGKITFTEIKLPQVGKYTFTVTEVKGRNISITYDETVFTVSVEVVNDNGTLKAKISYPDAGIVFENVYEKYDPENPDTGDRSGMALYAVTMAASLIGFAVVVVIMSKRNRRKSVWA